MVRRLNVGFSFFGGSKTTKTTVKPDPRVTSMLKDVLNRAKSIDDFNFIEHNAATMNQNERQAINELAASGNVRAVAGALAPRALQGINQATKLNEVYENAANNPITAQEVLDTSKALKGGLYSAVQQTAQSAGNVAGRLGSGAARAAARRGASQMQARNNLDPSFTNRAIENATGNRENTLDVAGLQGQVANANVNLGMQGIDLARQATMNQLTAGDIMQGYQNALFSNQQANEQGRNDFIWQKIANKQSILGNVSNMAGYTQVDKGDGVSKGRQLLGAGVTALGAAASKGYLGNPMQTANAWSNYNVNGGQSGVAGPMPSGSAYGNLSQAPQQQQGFASKLWTGAANTLGGMFDNNYNGGQ